MSAIKWKENVELIGIIAIIVSLGAVVYELRQTQSALVASTYQERAFDAIHEAYSVAGNDELIRVMAATNSGEDFDVVNNLGPEDALRIRHFLRARMVDWDNEFYQYQHGYLDPDFFETTTIPSIKRYAPRWRNVGLTEGRAEFRQFVDELLAGDD